MPKLRLFGAPCGMGVGLGVRRGRERERRPPPSPPSSIAPMRASWTPAGGTGVRVLCPGERARGASKCCRLHLIRVTDTALVVASVGRTGSMVETPLRRAVASVRNGPVRALSNAPWGARESQNPRGLSKEEGSPGGGDGGTAPAPPEGGDQRSIEARRDERRCTAPAHGTQKHPFSAIRWPRGRRAGPGHHHLRTARREMGRRRTRNLSIGDGSTAARRVTSHDHLCSSAICRVPSHALGTLRRSRVLECSTPVQSMPNKWGCSSRHGVLRDHQERLDSLRRLRIVRQARGQRAAHARTPGQSALDSTSCGKMPFESAPATSTP